MANQRTYRDEYYPSVEIDFCEENLEMFFKFMYERHMIWHRRFVKKMPKDKWTDDPILKVTKYTNIYRQLDRGTLWYLQTIGARFKRKIKSIDKKRDAGKLSEEEYDNKVRVITRELIFLTIMYRLCNRIETFEYVGIPKYRYFNIKTFYNRLMDIRNSGQSVMTSAHLTCPAVNKETKVQAYTTGVLDAFIKASDVTDAIFDADTPKKVFKALRSVYGVGGFTGYEIYCDLCYLKAIPWTTNDFVNVGPGAKEGIRLIYPSTKGSKEIEDRLWQIHGEQHTWWKMFAIDFPWYNKYEPVKDELSLRCIEHSLCEFSKYWLQNHNLGKQRMKFEPNTHTSNISDYSTGDKLNISEDILNNTLPCTEKDKKTAQAYLKLKGTYTMRELTDIIKAFDKQG